MNVLIAVDSYKGNLTSLDVAQIVVEGIRRVYPDAEIQKFAMADGGEGTAQTLTSFLHGEMVSTPVMGPNGAVVNAKYGILQGSTAIMEMAEASGITLVPALERNPMKATTYGTGQMIRDALNRDCRKVIIGIGGSATNDGGVGMAAALGAVFLDEDGRKIGLGGADLSKIADIDLRGLDPRLKDTQFIVACDVNNPLCGVSGASAVFGPQKGATPEMVNLLDKGLKNYAEIIQRRTGYKVTEIPGSGAAGGLGAGLIAFCGADLRSGIDIVMDILDIENAIRKADVVITGEGRVDAQTAHGKVPAGIAMRAKKYGKPVFAVAGYADQDAKATYECGIDAVVSSITAPMTNEEAIQNSVPMIRDAAERLFRILHAAGMA